VTLIKSRPGQRQQPGLVVLATGFARQAEHAGGSSILTNRAGSN
jgi:hypothetical protein